MRNRYFGSVRVFTTLREIRHIRNRFPFLRTDESRVLTECCSFDEMQDTFNSEDRNRCAQRRKGFIAETSFFLEYRYPDAGIDVSLES